MVKAKGVQHLDFSTAANATDQAIIYPSFEALRPHVLNAGDAQSREALYHGLDLLLRSTTSLSTSGRLPPGSVATFLQSLMQGLPSTSTDPFVPGPLGVILEDVILDLLWTVDVDLDDEVLDDTARNLEKASLVQLLTALLVCPPYSLNSVLHLIDRLS